MFDIQYTGLTQLTVRLGNVGNRVVDALEAETRRQMGLMSAAVKENIGVDFRNPSTMQSAVQDQTTRTGDVIVGEVDASGRLSGVVLPYMSILESGGQTRAHVISAGNSVLAFFWERQGVQFFGRRVNHPGSKFPAYHFMLNAFNARKGEMLTAFAQVVGATVREAVAA